MSRSSANVDLTPLVESLRAKDAQTIRDLKDELWETRMLVLRILPERHRRHLELPSAFSARRELNQWLRGAIDAIVRQAVEDARLQPAVSDDEWIYLGYDPRGRMPCPLCGCERVNGGGFLPLGLDRHLDGYGSNERCEVMRAVVGLGRSRVQQSIK